MYEHFPRGGFKRAFGCGEFIRGFLTERGEEGSPQRDIFFAYKTKMIQGRAEAMAEIERDRQIAKGVTYASVDFEGLMERARRHFPYRTTGARYHSFVMYFSILTFAILLHLNRMRSFMG